MNNFEQFLKDKNKGSVKIKLDPDIWNTIENELIKGRNNKNRFFIPLAASFLIIIVFGTIIRFAFLQSNSEKEFTLSEYSVELGLLEKDFKRDIHNKVLVLRESKIPLSLKSNFNFLVDEFYTLDNNYKNSIDNIKLSPLNEFLQNEIIKHYKNKLKILDRIQEEIYKINKIEKENNYENKKVLLHI